MDPAPIIDPVKVQGLIASLAGAFTTILFQRDGAEGKPRMSKTMMFLAIWAAEVTSYFFGLPVWKMINSHFAQLDEQWQAPISFTIGLLSIFIWGGLVKMGAGFMESPIKMAGDIAADILARFFPGRFGGR